MIPATIRTFSIPTIKQVVGMSRTTLWRRKQRGRLGVDVIRFMEEQRRQSGLPPLPPEAAEDVLTALAAVEDARTGAAQPQP
jgi:hypothetical protein